MVERRLCFSAREGSYHQVRALLFIVVVVVVVDVIIVLI